MKKQQSGFTLVEIAIVLVIIGLLLGGVLKGQELVNSAKVKNLANDFRSVPIFIYGYQDKFKRLPGDDNGANRFAGYTQASTAGQTQGNGLIEGDWNSPVLSDESVLFWQHVRGAGLASGSIAFDNLANASLPVNSEGGRVGVQMTAPITGLSGSYYVCSERISAKAAQQLDLTMDDGVANTGVMRAQSAAWNNAAIVSGDANWPANGTMTVCMAF